MSVIVRSRAAAAICSAAAARVSVIGLPFPPVWPPPAPQFWGEHECGEVIGFLRRGTRQLAAHAANALLPPELGGWGAEPRGAVYSGRRDCDTARMGGQRRWRRGGGGSSRSR